MLYLYIGDFRLCFLFCVGLIWHRFCYVYGVLSLSGFRVFRVSLGFGFFEVFPIFSTFPCFVGFVVLTCAFGCFGCDFLCTFVCRLV